MYATQATSLVNFLAARFRNSEEALEVAQEAWIRLMRHNNPEGLENARAFLFQTANNLAIDRARRAAVEERFALAEAAATASDAAPSAEHTCAADEELRRLIDALGELPDATREAFVLHRFRGLPYQEIAAALGVSASMVEKHIIRALKQLRGALRRG
ncbi:MAG: sigma-70 family RNA polymerase sigma factor [Pseudomonadota bacterium]